MDQLTELKEAQKAANAEHDKAVKALTAAEELKQTFLAALARANQEIRIIRPRRTARRQEAYDEYTLNPVADALALAECDFKDLLRETFLAGGLAPHLVETAIPEQTVIVMEANLDVLRVRARLADIAVDICELEFAVALGPALQQQGGISATGALVERLRAERAEAHRQYAEAQDALRSEVARQKSLRQAREARGPITTTQVNSLVPRF